MDLPEVHGSPIIKVSNHLTDPELDPRQVYLKHHAFGLPCCGLSIISDVDCHVWNANEEKKSVPLLAVGVPVLYSASPRSLLFGNFHTAVVPNLACAPVGVGCSL